jgi:hypothetical protein
MMIDQGDFGGVALDGLSWVAVARWPGPLHDKKARKARIAIAGAVETVSGPLILPNTGQEHRVTVRLPEGREYLEMEVAQAMCSGALVRSPSSIATLTAVWPRSRTRTRWVEITQLSGI